MLLRYGASAADARARSFDAAMAASQSTRDQQVLSMYEVTTQLATLEPPQPELEQLLGVVHGTQEAMDDFARANAGVLSPASFSKENFARITSQAGAAAHT